MQTTAKKVLTVTATAMLTVIVFGYAYFRMEDFLEGPILSISAPKNGEMFGSALISVTGTSKNLSYLNMNGRKIFTDKTGNWDEKLLLQPGLNIIETRATDRFGRETKKLLNVVLKEGTSTVMTNDI